ncbi:MAG: hypothetical protein MRERC_6c034 [Mycoplasmataceae bacterium RC_NB112A]|nr:MAG: hypothetical protein MRERC_13c035 [Mycoplasmataceae bacterium RC_NB112A]KLL01947.1 MAG: hypothetical protein MRERC_6c034 [Mycoplasmataceae bacterium RC_NB112A]
MGMKGRYWCRRYISNYNKNKIFGILLLKGDIENIQITADSYGSRDGNLLNLGVSTCFFSRYGYLLDALGAYEGRMVDIEKEKLEAENKELENNQEKHKPEDLENHKPEDLKPANLPDNWESELGKIDNLEANQKPDDLLTVWKEQLAAKKQL